MLSQVELLQLILELVGPTQESNEILLLGFRSGFFRVYARAVFHSLYRVVLLTRQRKKNIELPIYSHPSLSKIGQNSKRRASG